MNTRTKRITMILMVWLFIWVTMMLISNFNRYESPIEDISEKNQFVPPKFTNNNSNKQRNQDTEKKNLDRLINPNNIQKENKNNDAEDNEHEHVQAPKMESNVDFKNQKKDSNDHENDLLSVKNRYKEQNENQNANENHDRRKIQDKNSDSFQDNSKSRGRKLAKDQKLLKPRSDDDEDVNNYEKPANKNKNPKEDIEDFKKSIIAKQTIEEEEEAKKSGKQNQQRKKENEKENENENENENEKEKEKEKEKENEEDNIRISKENFSDSDDKPNPLFSQISESTRLKANRLKDKVKEFFYFAYNNYLEKAFPLDELRPLSCSGVSKFGGVYLTLIDCMDTVAILGNKTEFRRIVNLLVKEVKNFDFDKSVSVFETNIRIVGGLLAGHMLASDPAKRLVPGYKGELLGLALDMAERLYKAFDTPTGVNYGAINLKHGVSPSESRITCSACAGTFALEFGLLTRLTGDPKWDKTAKNTLQKIWSARGSGSGGLMGNHIGIDNLVWMFGPPTGIGGHMDSAYEYMFKAGYMFKDEDYNKMWREAKKQIISSLYNKELKMFFNYGSNQFPSLAAFFPGVLALDNETDIALDNLNSIMKVWDELGALPELSIVGNQHAQIGSEGWPLRPEFPESLYHAFKVTRKEYLIDYGEKVLNTIERTKSKCGFASIRSVASFGLDDIMDSFFLAETLKYLYLLFDLDNFVTKGDYTFNTEAHLFPVFEIKEAHISNFPQLKKQYNLN